MADNSVELQPPTNTTTPIFEALTSKPTVYYIIYFSIFLTFIQALSGSIGVLVYLPYYGLTVAQLINALSFGFIVYFCVTLYISTIADNYESKWGRRKPFVTYGICIQILACIMFVLAVGKNTSFIGTWYLLSSGVYNLGAGMINYPLHSWYVESTTDNDDYRYLNTIVLPIFQLIGGFTALIVILVFGKSYALQVVVSLFILLIFCTTSLYLMITRVNNNSARQNIPTPPLVPSCRLAARTNEFRRLFWTQTATFSGLAIYANNGYFVIFSGYYDAVQKNDESGVYIPILVFVGAFIGLLMNVALNWILKYYDKLVLLRCLYTLASLICFMTFFTMLSKNDASWFTFFILAVSISAIYVPIQTLLTLMAKDLVNLDIFATGLNRENLFLTVLGLPTSVFVSIAAGIYLSIVTSSGYKQGNASDDTDDDYIAATTTYTDTSFWFLRIGLSFVPLLFIMSALWLLRNYSLTEEVSRKILAAIAKRLARKLDEESSSQYEVEQFDNLSEDRALLLNLSVEELKKVSITKEMSTYTFYSGSLNATLMLIRRLSKIGLLSAMVTSFLLIIAYVANTTVGNSGVASFIMTLLTVIVAYIVYEFYRYKAIRSLRAFDNNKLKDTAASLVDKMFVNYHTIISEKLLKAGIVLDAGANQDGNTDGNDDDRGSIITDIKGTIAEPLKGAVRDIDYAEENMDFSSDSSLRTTAGYKRIYFCIACIATFALIVIILNFTAK